jgi:hypothetical protein
MDGIFNGKLDQLSHFLNFETKAINEILNLIGYKIY